MTVSPRRCMPVPIPSGQVKTRGYRKAAPMPQHPAWCQHSKSRCLRTGCTRQEENTCFPACKQTHPSPPELIIVKPNCTHIPQHKLPGGVMQQSFCPGDATCIYNPPPSKMSTMPITSQGATACYFHQRMLSMGTFSCQPGEISHWRKVTFSTAS